MSSEFDRKGTESYLASGSSELASIGPTEQYRVQKYNIIFQRLRNGRFNEKNSNKQLIQ